MKAYSLRETNPLTAILRDLHPVPLLDVVRAKDAVAEAEEVLDVIHCRAAEGAGTELHAAEPWKPGQPVTFMYMPSGTHTITAGFRGQAVRLTVQVDQSTADVVQASFDHWKSLYPKQKPFGCFEHEEKAASVWPERFEWRQDGVYCAADPSDLGAAEVNGKRRRSWSPSFTTDADYTRATDNGKGVYVFEAGARGSAENPARITGIAFCCGTLTNKPAFKAISPVKAKEQDGQPDVVTATWSDAARAAAIEARKSNGVHGQVLKPGDIVGFHTPMEKHEESQHMHVIEDRDDRVLVEHRQGFEHWRFKPQSVHRKADLYRIPGEAAKATDPAGEADAVRAAAGAYAKGHDFHGNQYTREATYRANISSERANEMGYASHHLEAAADHQKAMDLHMEHGDKADAEGKDSTAAKYYKQALKHGVKAAFHKGRGEALDKYGQTLTPSQFENRHARGELIEHKTYEAYKQHHEWLLASGESAKATQAAPETPEAILASLAASAGVSLCPKCGMELAKNGTCSLCAPVLVHATNLDLDAIFASLKTTPLVVLASEPAPQTPEEILNSLAHTKGK